MEGGRSCIIESERAIGIGEKLNCFILISTDLYLGQRASSTVDFIGFAVAQVVEHLYA